MEQQSANRRIIKCPYCGHEYLPGEIFYPGDIEGKPHNVIRDALGKVIYEEYAEGEEPMVAEKYTCDACNKQFVVEPVVNFRVKKESAELDFSEKYVSLL